MTVPMPADEIQHAYKPNKSIQTALLELDDCLSKHGHDPTIIIFLDLKGAFERVDHCSILYYISKVSTKLANITRSYLSNRIATIFNQDYPDDNPRLKYTPFKSVPQGSKVSPLLFSIATGLALKWFKNRISSSDFASTSSINIVAYADGVAITISDPTASNIPATASKVTHLFKTIMNIFGGNLEPTKTEILLNEATASYIKELELVNTKIKPVTTVKWLGFNIKLKRNSLIKVVHTSSQTLCLNQFNTILSHVKQQYQRLP